jgi:hypothetical protein
MLHTSWRFFFSCTLSLLALPAHADVTVSSPNNATVEACKDYFTSSWASRIDMSNRSPHGDLLFNVVPAEFGDLSGFAYSNGLVTMKATGDAPFFRLLTPESTGQIIEKNVTRYGGAAPIKPSEYGTLTFRMNSSKASNHTVRWDKAPGTGYGFTGLIPTFTGWNTYQLDLAGVTLGDAQSKAWTNGDNYGLGIYPARFNKDTEIQVDWLQLTPTAASCSSFDVAYTATSGVPTSVFIDDNNDPSDGFHARKAPTLGTGSGQTATFSSNQFYTGTYKAIAFESPDYASHYLNRWDMSSSSDVSTVSGYGSGFNNTTNVSFSNSELCGTVTGGDAGFFMNLPRSFPIDASRYNKFAFSYKGAAGTIQFIYFNENYQPIGAANVFVDASASYKTYTIDLANPAFHPANAGQPWGGTIKDIRIDTEIGSTSSTIAGSTFCFDWMSLGTSFASSEPALPQVSSSPGNVTITKRPIAPVQQPDRRGGVDYFSSVRGNPANLDSERDIDRTFNLQSASIYPGNVYTDNGGAVRISDYLESVNTNTGTPNDGDPQVFFALRDTTNPIDASRFKIACTTLNLHKLSLFEDHTVLRYGWERDIHGNGILKGFTSDDIVLKTSGEAEYCVNLENLPIEEGVETINGNFWLNNPNGSGLPSFRVDPHEIGHQTPFRITDTRLAAHHEAHTQYAVVIGGDRDAEVKVYKNTNASTTGGTLIGTLPANRNTDVVLWDTTNEPNGTAYYVYTVVGNERFLSEAPVVINHTTFSDTTPPELTVLAPSADGTGRFDALNVAGHVVDGVRVATVEVLVDDVLIDAFTPDLFHLGARNARGSYPYSSHAGFNRSISLGGISEGAHTAKVIAYDTAGNRTTHTASFTKTSSNLTSPVSWAVPNEASKSVSVGAPPSKGQSLKLSLTPSGADLHYHVSGVLNEGNVNNCDNVRLKIADSKEKLSSGGFTFIFLTSDAADLADDNVLYRSSNVKQLATSTTTTTRKCKKVAKRDKKGRIIKKRGKVVKVTKCTVTKKTTPVSGATVAYIQADCGDGTGTSATVEVDGTKVGNADTKVNSLAEFIDGLRLSGTPS